MYLDYFGFQQEPFGSTPDLRCIFQSATHREALATLRCSYLSNRGFTVLIAPPGMGKTTLLFQFLDQIRATSRSVFLFDVDPEFTPREIVAYILLDLGLLVPDSVVEMHDLLKQVLASEVLLGRKFVLVIDEAQNLSDAALETVRLMSNFETSQTKLMQVILAGQPQLAETLSKPSLLQFRQRISYMCRIDPLSNQEIYAYICERINFAGYSGEALFTERALKLIAQNAEGTPRIINALCFNALSICCALQRRQVDERMVREVISDQRLGLRSAKEPLRSAYVSSAFEPSPPQPAQATLIRGEPQQGSSSHRLNLSKPFIKVAVLFALAAVGFGVYRTLRGSPNVISAAPHVEQTQPTEVRPQSGSMLTIEKHRQAVPGNFNEQQRRRQIKTVNPGLTNPDHIQPGQESLLPGPHPAGIENPIKDSVENRKAQ